MSRSYSSRLRAGGGGSGLGATTVLAAKVALAAAVLAAAAFMVPQLVSGADALLSKLYLFVTVHMIILVIWKLSDNKQFHAAAAYKDHWSPAPLHHPAALPPLLTEEAVLYTAKRKVKFAPDAAAARAEEYRAPLVLRKREAVSTVEEEIVSPRSCGGESCVTTESEEDATSAAKLKVEFAPAAAAARAEEYRAPLVLTKRAAVSTVEEEIVSPGSCGGDSCVTAESEEDATSAAKLKVEFAPAAAAARSEEYRAPLVLTKRAAVSTVEEEIMSTGSCGGESCVTTESEEDASSAAAVSAYVSSADTRQSVASPPARERAIHERGLSLPPPPAVPATDKHLDGADNDDANADLDLDATWNAIMQKTRHATAPASSS